MKRSMQDVYDTDKQEEPIIDHDRMRKKRRKLQDHEYLSGKGYITQCFDCEYEGWCNIEMTWCITCSSWKCAKCNELVKVTRDCTKCVEDRKNKVRKVVNVGLKG